MKTMFESHDLSLPCWGPYTKKHSGISHIPQANDGVKFDLSVFPAFYRRKLSVPNVRFEGDFYPWQADIELSGYTIRHELEWKDQVCGDISFLSLGEHMRLIRAEFHNNTDFNQQCVLHYMASAYDPVPCGKTFSVTGMDCSLASTVPGSVPPAFW